MTQENKGSIMKRKMSKKLSQVHSAKDLEDSVNIKNEKDKSMILGPTPPPEKEAPYVRQIPPTLLTKPLPPEKLQILNEDEKRLYNIQRGKYDTYLRILAKKEQQGELPKDMRFSYNEAPMLLVGAHHDDEEEDEEANLQETPMNYMS